MTTKKTAGGGIPGWARWTISIVILVVLLKHVDLRSFGEIASRAEPAWLLLGMVMIFFEQVAVATAWREMLSAKGFKAPLVTMLHIIFVSNFIGIVFPSSTGSDFVKVLGLSKYMDNGAEALSSLFVFRVSGYVILFLIALAAALLFGNRLPDTPVVEAISLALIGGLIAGAVGLLFARKALNGIKWLSERFGRSALYTKLDGAYGSFWYYVRHGRAMAVALSGALFIQVDRIVYVYVIALALGLSVDPVALCVFVPIITTMTVIPVSISGIGVREGGYVLLFTHIGLSASEAISLSICGFALDIVYVMLGGVVYWLFGFPQQKKPDGPGEEPSHL